MIGVVVILCLFGIFLLKIVVSCFSKNFRNGKIEDFKFSVFICLIKNRC